MRKSETWTPMFIQKCTPKLVSLSPGKAVGLFAGGDLIRNFQILQIYNRNFVLGADGHKSARAIGRNQDACRTPAEFELLNLFVSRHIQHHQIRPSAV